MQTEVFWMRSSETAFSRCHFSPETAWEESQLTHKSQDCWLSNLNNSVSQRERERTQKIVIKGNSRIKKEPAWCYIRVTVSVYVVCVVSDPFRHWWMFVNIWDASWKAPGRTQGDTRRANTSVLHPEYCMICLYVRAQCINLNQWEQRTVFTLMWWKGNLYCLVDVAARREILTVCLIKYSSSPSYLQNIVKANLLLWVCVCVWAGVFLCKQEKE